MNKKFLLQVYTTSLTIFAMLFGAGNSIFPLRLGIESGAKTFFGLAGFLITGVLLPLLGLLAIIGFNGNYKSFFGRVGKVPGFLLTLFCMMVIGPFVAMPRIVALSYEMLHPFLPPMHVGFFASFFLLLVFIVGYKQVRLLDIIGKVLSPLKLLSLTAIIILGFFKAVSVAPSDQLASAVFMKGLQFGYYTLDLLTALFFGSIVVTLLSRYAHADERITVRSAVSIATISSIFAALLLAAVYIGMSMLGAYHGHGLEHLNEGQILSSISFALIGSWGAALIGIAIFLACFTTTVSLAAVVTDYVRCDIACKKINFPCTMALVLGITAFFSYFGLADILRYSIPVIVASYPIFIVITLCNFAYTLFGFKTIKMPTLIISIIMVCLLFK